MAYYSTFLPRETCDVVVSFLLGGRRTRVPEWFYADNKNAQEDATTNEIPLMEEQCQEHKERKTKKLFFSSCVCVWLVDSNNFGRVSHHTSPSIYYPRPILYNTYTTFSCLFFFLRLCFFVEIVSFPLSPHTLGCIASNQLAPLYYVLPFQSFCFFSGIFIERARRSCLGYNCDGNIHSSLSPTHSPRPWRGYSENIYQILYSI